MRYGKTPEPSDLDHDGIALAPNDLPFKHVSGAEKGRDEATCRPLVKLARWGDLAYASVIHDRHAVGHR